LFGRLFVQDVLKQVFIALNQPMRVSLSVLDLLLSVSLNSFEQSLQALVLLFTECCNLSIQTLLHLHRKQLLFFILLSLCLLAVELSLVVLAHCKMHFFLLALLEHFFAWFELELELGDVRFFEAHQFLLLLDFKLLNEAESRRLVVAHVLVPGLRELLEL